MTRPLTIRRVAGAAARRFPRRPFRLVLPARVWRGPFRFWLSVLEAQPDKRKAARELLELHGDLFRALDRTAVAVDEGLHVKHRLTRYHDFFVERVRPGERVLDVGSGPGSLAWDLVERSGAVVVGVDNNPAHLSFARRTFEDERLTFVDADLVETIPEGHFDVIVMSNVLEHFAGRIDLLRRLMASATPARVLVRVPVYARDWTVPFREELGLPHFSDPTHHVEYDEAGFRAELREAGLEVTELLLVWGEIWATAEPTRA
jgi:SAM-dependent methyltransferase